MLFRDAVGSTIRHLRRQRGLTLRDVAARSSVSLGYISEVERGRKDPSSEILAAVAVPLEVTVAEVVARAGRHMAAAQPHPPVRRIAA